MKSAGHAAFASLIALLLAFGVPAPAFAELSAGQSESAGDEAGISLVPADDTSGYSTFDEDGWRFERRDEGVFVICRVEDDEAADEGREGEAEGESAGASDADQASQGEATRQIQDGTAITLPETAGGEPVYGVAAEESGAWERFTSITLSSTIQVIDGEAFMKCTSLKEFVVPEGSQLRQIGQAAFLKCDDLENLSFPDDLQLESVGNYAFSETALESFAAPASLTSIGNYAFLYCYRLAKVSFSPESKLKTIGRYAFYESLISKVDLPASLEVIGQYAFSYCNKLARVTFAQDSSLAEIGRNAFGYDPLLSSISFPASLATIGGYAFLGCSRLSRITFPADSRLSEIGDSAFIALPLSSVDLPASLKRIGASAFSGCANLKRVTFPQADCELSSIAQEAFAQTALSRIVFPASLTQVGAGAFSRCANLLSVEFAAGSQLAVIGESAFSEDPLESLALPAQLGEIGAHAFDSCPRLTEVSFAEDSRLLSLGDYAFARSGVVSVALPSSLESIGANAFENCGNLVQVTVSDDSRLVSIGQNAFHQNESLTWALVAEQSIPERSSATLAIPSSVTAVGANAFAQCSKLLVVEGCRGLERIEDGAFSGTAIQAFPFGTGLRFVSGKAFEDCPNYESPAYPDYLDVMGGDYYKCDAQVMLEGTENYALAYEVLALVNAERLDKGLTPLEMDSQLLPAAMQRAAELAVRYSETRPLGIVGTSVSSKASAENIAAGWVSARSLVDAWMADSQGATQPTSKERILGGEYSSTGVGCFNQNGTLYWVQLFGTEAADAVAQPANAENSHVVDLVAGTYLPILSIGVGTEGDAPFRVGHAVRATVYCGESGQRYRGKPMAKQTFDFAMTDPTCASVDEDGMVTFLKPGMVTLVATLKGTDRSAAYTFDVADRISIGSATVVGLQARQYTGGAITQDFAVQLGGKTLSAGVDYSIGYSNNVSAGTAGITVTGKGDYKGSVGATFEITKTAQLMSVSAKTKKVSAKKVKKKARKVSALTVKKAVGTVKYKKASTKKSLKKFKVNSKNGKITVPKKTKKGSYKIKVLVSAGGDSNYLPGSTTVAFTIKVT